jgi:tRNA(Arg) A34 adenosine deaminase TadA
MTKPPVLDPKDPLALYWDKPVSALADVTVEQVSKQMAERHRIYSLLTLSLLDAFFNGNKKGAVGHYPYRAGQRVDKEASTDTDISFAFDKGRYNGDRKGDRYIGHNIVSIAVDEKGYVVDCEFNHNDIFKSSAEHAEARLIRRVYSLNQIHNGWNVTKGSDASSPRYDNDFNAVTIYTSLESCAQCSGIMALANVDRVIYLQTDPGQYLIGNMLYNLTGRKNENWDGKTHKYGAPSPISADAFGFSQKKALDDAYTAYYKELERNKAAYFYLPKEGAEITESNRGQGITSFLCTDIAKAIFAAARDELETFELHYGDFAPPKSDGKATGVKSNAYVLGHVRSFLTHVTKQGTRGTPHH